MSMMILASFAFIPARRPYWEMFADKSEGTELLIDSGAFSVARAGDTIDLNEYISFLKAHEKNLWQYIQLDVVGDVGASRRNLRKMLKAGLTPMPVLTADADIADMAELVEINPHICVAGGVHESSEYYRSRVEKAYRASGGKARLHGLGYTRGIEVVSTRCYSIDSSTWSCGIRYKAYAVFDRLKGVRQFAMSKYKHKPFKQYPKLLQDYLIRNSIDPAIIDTPVFHEGNLSFLAIAGACAALDFVRFCASKGVRCFLAVPTEWSLAIIACALNHYVPNGINWKAAQADIPEVSAMLGVEAGLTGFAKLCDYFNKGVKRASIRVREAAV